MRIDRNIFKAIKSHGETDPQDLVGILADVDSRERLLLTHEELSGGLQRLIESGQIAEATQTSILTLLVNFINGCSLGSGLN